MSFTTQEFINKIEFSYFETYSFNRSSDYNFYSSIMIKYNEDPKLLTNEEYLELKRLRKMNLEKNEHDYIITNEKLLNPTSELVYNSKGATDFNRSLANILRTPYTDHDAWMCWPVYRDAILFYNEKDVLIDGLNICFQCSSVLNLSNESILTDRKVFKQLLTLLINLGHKI